MGATDNRAKDIFMAALELPTEQRGAYLNAECADDAERAVVEELLDASLKADAYFDEFEQQLRPAADDSSGGIIGRRIGPYRIESFIGRGGMGTVYRAERADGQFSQEVAIKLLALGAMNRDAHRRFLAEREILARLQHPNIGRLLDGGVTEDGTPYFVMELVRGRRIDLFCDHEGLGVEERLRVFLQVCDAVAYAHDNNVVHRDLKPANILVTGEDVKLLDFGIAKLLPTDDGTRLTETGTGLSPMTPAYASPEQLRAQPITASTDVYALGVVLHELLVGMSPYERGKDSSVAMVQAICERPVAAPSTRLRRLGGEETQTKTDAQGIADARRTSIVQLSRRIRGDLDTILLKALRKEPEQRYASVRAFAEDIRRHLEGFPVFARPESRTYRASRFIGRHKIASSAAAVAAVLALGLVIVAVIFARTSEKQTRDLTQEQDLSRELLSQLTDLYEAADPTASPGATAAARQLLDKAVDRLREQKSGDPLTRATLLFHAGRVYDRLGATSEARPLLTECFELRTEHLSEPCEELEEVTYVLGSNEVRGGTGERGVRRMEEALEIAREVHGDDHVHVAQIRFSIGRSYHDTGVTGDAGTMFREAVRIYREHVPEPTTEYVDVLISLSDLTSVQGDLPKAMEYVREALEINLELNGEVHPLTGRAYNRLGMLSYNQGQREVGLGLLRQSVEVQRAVYGDVPHYDLAVALQNTGRWLAAEGDWDGVAALGEAVEIFAAQDEVDGSTLGFCQMLLGDALRSFGDNDSAALAYEDALASFERYEVAEAFQVQTKSKLVAVLRQKGPSDRAIELLGDIADTYATMFDEDHPRVVEARAELERARQ